MPGILDIEKERALILRIRQNERPAFDELAERLRESGFAVAYSFTGNPDDAKDVLQEAFIKMYTSIAGFREESRLSTWFYRIVVNCSLDFLRKKKSTRTLPVPEDEEGKEMEFADSRADTAREVADRQLRERLDECVAGLPRKQRVCFVLKHENGLSNSDIARILGCGVQTVKVHLFRAAHALRRKMAPYLREEGGDVYLHAV